MRIGLIDVDKKNFPNLALMKLSAWHKAQGDEVEFASYLTYYDKVYMSKVFDETYSKDADEPVLAKEIIKGGTGYDLQNKLPEEIEHMMPDYSLYGMRTQLLDILQEVVREVVLSASLLKKKAEEVIRLQTFRNFGADRKT